jgi:hypothetical protein
MSIRPGQFVSTAIALGFSSTEAQQFRSFGLVAELPISFVQADHCAGTGREPTVWIQGDPLGGDVFKRLSHA